MGRRKLCLDRDGANLFCEIEIYDEGSSRVQTHVRLWTPGAGAGRASEHVTDLVPLRSRVTIEFVREVGFQRGKGSQINVRVALTPMGA